jgi:accessory gene regulator protein AgrB
MEIITNRIVKYLDADETIWNDVDRMYMVLGLEVLIHNIIMIGTILVMAWITKIFREALILLIAFGALKMSAGGVHFKKSSPCLIGTGIFIWLGVWFSGRLDMKLSHIVLIYFICFITLIMIGPQGTENNPISEENYNKLRKKIIFLVLIYLIITAFIEKYASKISYLLLISVVFETLSLLPSYVKNRSV